MCVCVGGIQYVTFTSQGYPSWMRDHKYLKIITTLTTKKRQQQYPPVALLISINMSDRDKPFDFLPFFIQTSTFYRSRRKKPYLLLILSGSRDLLKCHRELAHIGVGVQLRRFGLGCVFSSTDAADWSQKQKNATGGFMTLLLFSNTLLLRSLMWHRRL